jgi:hypothetical protein
VAGCDLSLPNLDEVTISCESTDDCPEPLTCQNQVCLSRDEVDDAPPDLIGDPVVDPPVLGRNETLTLTFEVTERLREDPRVTAAIAGVDRLLTLDEKEGLTCTFTVEPEAGDPQNVTIPISIKLIDRAGLESGTLSGGPFCDETDYPFSPGNVAESVIVVPDQGQGFLEASNRPDILLELSHSSNIDQVVAWINLLDDDQVGAVALQGWREGQWETVQSGTYSIANPGELLHTLNTETDISDFLLGEDAATQWRVRSPWNNLNTPPTLFTDYAEIRFRYVLP